MKAKNCKAVIRKKVEQFAKSIKDASVREAVANNTIVTGGCIASMLLREKVRDFDLYFRDRATTIAVANYFVREMNDRKWPRYEGCTICVDTSKPDRISCFVKSAGVATSHDRMANNDDEDPGSPDAADNAELADVEVSGGQEEHPAKPTFRPIFITSNAISLSDKVQLITRFYGEPDEIHENYDFVHCTNYWSSWNDELVLRKEALESLLAKELRYVGSKYPLCSIIRTRKFLASGWTINAGQYLKMAMQLNGLDLRNIDVLEEQLIGVDAAYFHQLISALRAADLNHFADVYVANLVDQIF